MKQKYVAILLGAAMVMSTAGTTAAGLTVMAEESVTENSTKSTTEAGNAAVTDETAQKNDSGQDKEPDKNGRPEEDENQVRGEITAVGESSVTIKTDAGDETEISITDDTEITRQSMGGPGGAPQGQPGENGEAPEKPDGENSSDTNGQSGENGEAPEKPDGENSSDANGQSGENGEAPEKPDGENSSDANGQPGENGEAPEKPDGENSSDANGQSGENGGAPQDQPGGGQETIALSDLAKGDQIMITLNDDGTAASITVMSMDGGQGGGMAPGGAPGGQQGAPDSYDAENEYTEDAESDGESFVSTGTDENAILVDNGANVTIKNAQVSRQSSDSTGGDNSSFYGIGAAVLAKDGTVNVSDSEITTDAAGAAGVFAYGDGTAYVSDTTITTKQDTSGGIHVAGGGTLYAWNVNAETSGESSAAIRSDRGGGTIVADGGTYTSNGVGSPAIYSTADIAVNDAQLTANGSEAVCIEGLNSIHLFNSDLTGNMADDEQNDCTWNVILYQSMSGDSEVGNSTFEMEGGSLTAKNGGMFYTTNTESTFLLSGVDITYADDSEFFLRCTGNENRRGWGSVGSNGADCLFTAKEQEMQGDVIWDSVSDLDFYMTDGSTLTGAVVDDESCAGEGGDGVCSFYISDDSTWVVTGDSTLTDLQCAGTITDENGNTVSVVGTDGTVYVDGDSEWTVTVESYEDTADLSGAAASTTWNDYAVDQQA